MRKTISLLLVCLMLILSFAACGNSQAPATKNESAATESKTEAPAAEDKGESTDTGAAASGNIVVWTWESYDNQKAIIEDFNKDFPDINVEFSTVQSTDMPMKIQTAIASDSDVPDACWSEIGVRGKMLALECWEDLSAEPYNISKTDILDFMLPVHTTPSGKMAGMEVSTPVAGMAYKRNLTLEYFGTEDPEELQKLIPTWDAFIEKGLEVKAKSGGKTFMASTMTELYSMILGQNATPFVNDDKLNLTAAFKDTFDLLISFKQAGIVDNLDMWTPGWDSTFNDDSAIFYGCATWVPTYVIKPKSTSGEGNWGLMLPPGGGYMWGGTGVYIPNKAKNKMAAFEYVKWNYASEAGAISNRNNLEYMTSYKPVYTDADFYSKPDDFFKGQDLLKTFAQAIIPNMAKTRPANKYDAEVNDAAALAVKTIKDSDGSVTAEQVIADMSKEIITKAPELKPES